ncbi:MAG: type VI secretion system PAAR protein [Aeromonas veronii]
MSKKAATVGDIGTDHDGFPPTSIIEGSQDIIIDNKPAARVGDALAPHAKPNHPPHDRAITTGSKTVLFNYKPAALTGSEVGCGGVIIGGSSVIIGDQAPPIISSFVSNLFFDKKLNFSSTFSYIIEDENGKQLSSGCSVNAYSGLVKSSGLINVFIGGDNE